MQDRLMEQFARLPGFVQAHSRNVAERMFLLAAAAKEEMEVPYSLREVYEAGLLHDIGKGCVGGRLWTNTAPLTSEDWELIRQHPSVGGRVVSAFGGSQVSIDCALHHHERLDGSGYPDHLTGTRIPLIARICGIADSFDAMTSGRPYGRPRTCAAALDELRRCSGTQFDGTLVMIFERHVFPKLRRTNPFAD